MSILSKIITRAIVKPALRGKVTSLPPRGSQRTQMEALGFNKAPEDIPEDIPIVAPAATRAEVPETTAKDVGQQKRMNLIYGIEPSPVQQVDEAIPSIRTEMDELMPPAGGRGVINEDTASLEEIEKFYKLPENQRQAQTPQLKEAAQSLQKGEITKQEFDEIADTFYPAKLITEMPEPPHARRIEAVLGKKVKSRPVVDETISKELDGKRFGTRLDIPAYNIYDTWVVTVHGPGKAGKALHYSKTAYLTDVVFMSDPSKALKVATEDTTKIPFARMEGRWKDMTPDDVYDLAAEELNKPNSKWVQIGMNPYKHSYFYDKITMQPILSALEVIQVGPLVLARNVKRGNASDFAFEEGGVVSLLPTNARVFIESVLLGEKSPISEKDFTKDELAAIKKLILTSQQWHRGPEVIDEARKIYGLGPTTAENTSQANAPRKWLPPSKKGVVDYSAYRKTDDLGGEGFGFLNTISPIGRIKTTLGQFGYKRLPSGDVLVGDEYDFSKYYSEDVSIGERILDGILSLGYKPIRQYASEVLPEGSGRKVGITIPREQFTDKEYKSLFGDEISTLNMLMMSKGGVVDMRDGGRVRMAKGGSTSYQATPEFLKYLISVENPGSEGLKGGKWYPYPSTGKNKDTHDEIGYGIEILKDTYAAGLTQKQIDTLFKERLMKASEEASRVVDKQLGSGTFSSLSRKKQDAFVDYAYNLGEGTHIRSIDKKTGKIKDKYTGFTAYKKFIRAFVNDDREAVLREYKRHVKQSDGKWAELGRNKHFMKYFSEFFPEKERSRASYSFSYFPKQTIL